MSLMSRCLTSIMSSGLEELSDSIGAVSRSQLTPDVDSLSDIMISGVDEGLSPLTILESGCKREKTTLVIIQL